MYYERKEEVCLLLSYRGIFGDLMFSDGGCFPFDDDEQSWQNQIRGMN